MSKTKKKEQQFSPDDFAVTEENKDDFKSSTIQRSNIQSEFTINDIEEHQKSLDKMETELEGQAKIARATLDNMDRNHEWITKLSDEELHHAWMYKENKDVAEKSEEKLEQVQEQKGVYEELIAMLYKKFGFVETTADVAEQDNGEEGSTEKE